MAHQLQLVSMSQDDTLQNDPNSCEEMSEKIHQLDMCPTTSNSTAPYLFLMLSFCPFLPSFACKRQQKSLLAQRTRIIFLFCAGTTQMDCPASLSFLWWSLSCWLAIGSPLTRARSLCVYLPARACLALPCRTSPSPRGHTASVSITCPVVRLFLTVYRPSRENW